MKALRSPAVKKLVKLNVSELSSEDVDYIINLLQTGTADPNLDDEENPSALSAKFLAALKDSIINKKVFRIDFDNEISVIIPCHRVVGSKGHITGYAGGLVSVK